MQAARGCHAGSFSKPGPPGEGAWRDRVGMVGVCLCVYEERERDRGDSESWRSYRDTAAELIPGIRHLQDVRLGQHLPLFPCPWPPDPLVP